VDDEAEVGAGTHPAKADTDLDGFTDGDEATAGTDPDDPFSWTFGTPNWPDLSPYADGVYSEGWDQGEIMPNFQSIDQFGATIELYRFYGYVVLVDFSAGWCVPCRVTAETAEAMWVEHRADGFMIIHVLTEGMSPGSPASLALQEGWAGEYGINFPVVRESPNVAYSNMTFTDLYPGSIPFLVLLDRNMRIDSAYGANSDAAITARLQVLLQEPAPEKHQPVISGEIADLDVANVCDQDGDGHQNFSCGGDDCFDRDPGISPSNTERCDVDDHNCDGFMHLDASNADSFYLDGDLDGYGTDSSVISSCGMPWSYVANMDDCDDADDKTNPDTIWYLDADEDGLGNPEVTMASCTQPDGYVSNGQDADDSSSTTLGCWSSVTVGRDHTCALKTDGTPVCWGNNSDGETDITAGVTFAQIDAGYQHTCGREANGSVTCWGTTMWGATVAPVDSFIDISCGLNFCCGLTGTTGDNVKCWGANDKGQTTPPPGTFKQVNARGGRHACGIDSNDEIVCWGGPEGFQGSSNPLLAPSGTYTFITAGHFYNMAIGTDGSAVGWGSNTSGKAIAPANVSLSFIAAGTVHTCGLDEAGNIHCWGSPTFDRTNSPDGIFTQLDVNQLHSCAVGQDGLISCWGFGDEGQTMPPACTQ
jgi:thiol-disulfide isomerase/thioredoxin